MAEYFTYHFERKLPWLKEDQSWERYQGLPLIGEVVAEAQDLVKANEQFGELPERNQKLLLDMASFAVNTANNMADAWEGGWKRNFWGLYIVGSRARGEAKEDSDLDLLSAGSFYHRQGFESLHAIYLDDNKDSIYEGFEIERPEELPSEYNVGDVDRKYILRAKPQSEGVLPVDVNVVDLTFIKTDLEHFKSEMDVDEDGRELPRIPLFEVTVAASR